LRGFFILSTADKNGNVDAAIYSRPHFLEGDTLAFIMRDRLSHKNIESNPHAVYLFIEDGPGKKGTRLYLTKIKEEKNSERIDSLKRRKKQLVPTPRLSPLMPSSASTRGRVKVCIFCNNKV